MLSTTRRRSVAVRRVLAVTTAALLAVSGAPLLAQPASAVDVPNADFTQAFSIQTNGRNGAITLGDYYSATTAQGGAQQAHSLTLNVPCSWPATLPIYLDLFSPQINTATTGYPGSQTYEEPAGAGDTTTYTLNGPTGAPLQTTTYQPINSTTDSWSRFATLAAPVACGQYTLLDTTSNDDQNGWKARLGTDNDANPNNAPPANSDNPDGLVGTDDELTVGLQQISYQHDLGNGSPAAAKCLTLYEYVAPGLASVTFNNFDMDNASLAGSGVRYYAPSAAFDPTGRAGGIVGTISGNGTWNKVGGGGTTARSGDTVANPESGWWKLVTCIDNHNQFIQEGQAGQPVYFTQPPTPVLQVAKTDGETVVDPGQRVTYTVTATNAAVGSTAGAATKVVSKDTLPAGLTPVSCTITGATAGESCTFAGQVATATFTGAIPANGGARSFTVVADVVTTGTPASFLNSVSTTYSDSIGNAYVPVVATDTDTRSSANLAITKAHSGAFTIGAPGSYAIGVTNVAGSASRARGVTVVDTLPAGLQFVSGTGTGWTCTATGQTVTCRYAPDLAVGSSTSLTIAVNVLAAAFPSRTNSATVSSSTPDPTPGNNTATDPTTVVGASLGDLVFNDANGNGLRDVGETGVSGVTVRLLDGTGATLATTTTDGAGAYQFAGLDAGTYRVQFVAPTGAVFTLANQGADPTIDSDANRSTGTSPPVTLTAGQTNTTLDAGLVAPATIGDLVYDDADGSGTFTTGDTGLVGQTVTLTQAGATVASTTTGTGGSYSFTGLTAGTYVVTVSTPGGFTATGPRTSPRTVVLTAGQSDLTEDFGFVQSNAQIGDLVWNDLNGNGLRESGEPGVQGVTLTLTRGGATVGTTTSALDGSYLFTGLTAGTYVVTASTLPSGFVVTTSNPITVPLAAGASVLTADVGLQQRTSVVGDTVFVDANSNGTQDTGEVGLNGVTVALLDGAGTQIGAPTTTSTIGGVAGRYAFSGLAAGTYQVRLTVPTGYLATTATTLSRPVAAGTTVDTYDFGVQQAQGSIGDTVFNDLNGNGTQDSGEPGLSGRTVTLTGPVGATTTTGANGSYLFSGLPAGSYTVSVATPNNFTPTSPVRSPLSVTLGATQAFLTADFGFQQTNASVGDTVFNDLNGNGTQETGEPAVDGVTVTLLRGGTTVATTTTAAGTYAFTGLPAGSYTVQVTPPTGFVVTTSPAPLPVTLTAGQSVLTADVGILQSDAVIGDLVFDDVDGNGLQALTGEPGLAGVTVTLTRGGVTRTQVTDANGAYAFTALPAGTFTLAVTTGLPTGYTATTTVPRTVTVTAGQVDRAEDLGFRNTSGSLGDTVFNDLNGNGTQDTGEPGLGARTVTLTQGGTSRTTTTDANGLYSFTGLGAGTYTVSVPTPLGFLPSTGTGSQASPSTVTLTAGQARTDVDFGFLQSNASIGDTVFLDTNGDGVQNGAEVGYVGATVTLLYAGPDADFTTTADNTTATTTSATGGTYSFTGLRAGSYRVTLTAPTGFAVTTTNPLAVGLGAGQNLLTADLGLQRRDGSLSGTVYADRNGSATRQTGEDGTGSPVTVTLRRGTTVVATTTADPTTGAYAFGTLPAGSYTVTATVPVGSRATTPNPVGATVTDGAATTSVDIGLQRVDATLTGTVFTEDGPGNGIRETGEPGLAGVTVTLTQGGTTLATTTSGTGGAYSFPNVAEGTYTVRYTAPSASYALTTGTPRGTVAGVTAVGGTTTSGIDLGLTLTNGSIGDLVYNDADGSASVTPGDTGIPGATVTVQGGGPDNDPDTAGDNPPPVTATTASDGSYAVTGLVGGRYRVTVTDPGTYGPATTPTTGLFTLVSGGAVTSADFGFRAPSASIGDTVFDDQNGDGIQQPTEPGLDGVTVSLATDTGVPVGTPQTTSGGGRYSFTGLTPGNYVVTVTVPAGRYATTDVVIARAVAANAAVTDADAGLALLASVGDLVFDDSNGDGSPAGETGLAGATVTVTGVGTNVTTAATGGSGAYAVSGLKAGTYAVTVTLPTGYVATTVTSYTTTLTPGQALTTDDFGAQQRASSVSGTVYAETDGVPGRTGTDPGLQGASVVLSRGGTSVATALSDATGAYSFPGLPAGSYTVTVTPPTGYTGLAPTSQTATLTGANAVTLDFAERQTNASIGDTVYVDTNNNNVQDGAEVGLDNVTVNLYSGATATGTPVATTTTATSGPLAGQYLFAGLAAGQYTAQVVPPTGYTVTSSATRTLTLTAGQTVRIVDFGLRTLGVTGTVYRDAGNDGPTPGEPGVAGVTVALDDGTTVLTTTTDSTGGYSFVGLPAATYTVTVTVPTGFQASGVTSRTATVTTAAGVAGIDFEIAPKDGSLGDLVFNDSNGDGLPTGDTGLQGGTVTVSQAGTTKGSATSAADGSYLVSGLAAGDYLVTFTPPTGFTTTTVGSRTVTVTSGATNGTADFGARQTNASLGDEVYVDTNGNDLRDTGEPLYTSAITLTLGGAATATTTTSTGLYVFDTLAAGDYTVTLTAPPGYRVSTPLPRLVTLASGQNLRTADLGLEPVPGALSGTVFTDVGADGTRGPGDTPVSGQAVVVSRGGTVVRTLTTDVNGAYSLSGLPLGTYTVTVTGPTGTAPSTPASRTVVLTSGAPTSAGNDFGLAPATSSIGDTVFGDTNGNGTQDTGEAGRAGVTVTLTRGTTTVGTATTAADGTYRFSGLVAGDYVVTAAVPTGAVATGAGATRSVTLPAATAFVDADFGIQQVDATLTGLVFGDTNGSAVRDGAETGLGGITVRLSGGPTSKADVVTAPDGSYTFGSLAPGTYTVTAVVPAGSTATTPSTVTVTVTSATATSAPDIGLRTTSGSITGPVFTDTNGNGVDDGASDPARAGVTVTLSQGGTAVATTTTAGDGTYSFTGLPAGTYSVTATTPAGTTASTPLTGSVTVGAAAATGPAFGFQPTNGAVAGTVFLDTSRDGVQQPGETGYQGATVSLTRGGTAVAATTTAADGTYSFTGLPPATYTVTVSVPAGYVGTSPTTLSGTVTPTAGVTGLDVGLLRSDASLTGTVYDDRDTSGTKNGVEPGRSGVTVTLTRGGTTVATTTTDARGSYLFTGLPAGSYTVTVTVPGGLTATTPAVLSPVLTDGQQLSGLDVGLGVASVGDTVFDDANGNGTQDAGELGLAGVTVTLRQGGATLDSVATAADGTYRFDSLTAGTYTVTVSVPTGRTATTPATVTVSLAPGQDVSTADFGVLLASNRPPAYSSAGTNTAQSVPLGSALTPLAATDPDNDPLTYVVQTGTLPPGTTLNPNGTFTGTPTTVGTFTADIDVIDGRGGVATTTLVVTVTNTAPVFTSAPTNTAQTIPGGGLPLPLRATDANGDPLTFTLTSGSLPAGVTLNADGTFAGAATTPGRTTAVVTVDDGRGGTARTTLVVTVTATATPPVAVDDAITTPSAAPLTFDPRSNDSDPNGQALTVVSTSTPTHGSVTCTPAGAATSCTYTPTAGYAGPDSFTYVLRNASGLTATATVSVTVTNTPPAFTSSPSNTAQSIPLGGTPAPFQATDANGDRLTYAVTGGTLPPGTTLNPDGTFTGRSTTPGTTSVTVTVSDGNGGTATTTLAVTVGANDPPTFSGASGNTAQTLPLGTTPVPVTATDPNSDRLTYSVTGGTLPAGVTLNPDGTFSGTTTAVGTTTVTLGVADGRGGTASTTLVITVTPPADRAPVAVDDAATVTAGSSVDTPVLANDTDPDSDPLSLQSVTQPAHGTVVCDTALTTAHPAVTCTYTPAAGYTGPDSYDYVVSDGRGLTDVGTVTVTVGARANRPPVFDGTPNNTSQTVVVGGAPVPLTASDPDGDPLVFTITSGTLPPGLVLNPDGTFSGTATTAGGPTTVTITVTDGRGGNDSTSLAVTIIVTAVGGPPVAVNDTATTATSTPVTTQVLANDTDPDGNPLTVVGHGTPAHGTVVCTATACTYTPTLGYAGPDSYPYTISDGTGNTATATVAVTVSNAPPAFDGTTGNTSQVLPVGSAPAPVRATDPNGDPLTYAVTGGTLPAGVTLNPGGTFGGAATTPGTTSVTITATDGKGGAVATTLVLTVVAPINRPPVAAGDAATTAGVPVNVPVLANDTDPDRNPLTVAAFTQPTHGTVSCTATLCTYTPDAGYAGPDAFTYTVSDGFGGLSTATVTLTVTAANRPPVAAPDSATTLEDTPITLAVVTNDRDPEGDPLTVTAFTQPTKGTVTCTAGACTYSPAPNTNGTDTFTYTVSDGTGGTSTTTVTVVVTPVNDPPRAGRDRATTPGGKPVDISVLGNDTDADGNPLSVTAVSQPGHGTVTCTLAGVCTYTPAAGYTGNDAFTYTVSDGFGGTGVGRVDVVVVNRAPVLGRDPVTVTTGTTTTIAVLDNDSDPDGDPLTILRHSDPRHGTAVCSGTSCTYTADAGYTGTDGFTYTVTDGHGHTVTTTVPVTVAAAAGGGSGGNGGNGSGSGGGTGGTGSGGTGSGPTGSGNTGGTGGGTGAGGGMPFTGDSIGAQVGWGVSLLGLGLLLLLAGRRPRRGSPTGVITTA